MGGGYRASRFGRREMGPCQTERMSRVSGTSASLCETPSKALRLTCMYPTACWYGLEMCVCGLTLDRSLAVLVLNQKPVETSPCTDGDEAIIESHSKVSPALAQSAQRRNIGPFLT